MYYETIKTLVENNWVALEASQYPEDLLREWADSDTPIYNNDIYRYWGDLPDSQARDAWRDTGIEVSPNDTILDLMRIDLFLYLEGLYNRAYSEILATKEAN